jgi:hypothetical protein
MDIAFYYLESPVFLAITQNEKFRSITFNELLRTEHAGYLRNDSNIIDDGTVITWVGIAT